MVSEVRCWGGLINEIHIYSNLHITYIVNELILE